LRGYLNEDALVVRPHGLTGLTGGASATERAALRDPERVVCVRKSCVAYREGLLEHASKGCSALSANTRSVGDVAGLSSIVYALRLEYRFSQGPITFGERGDQGDDGSGGSGMGAAGGGGGGGVGGKTIKKSQKKSYKAYKFSTGALGDRGQAVASKMPLDRRRRFGELGLLSLAVGSVGEAASANGAPVTVKRRGSNGGGGTADGGNSSGSRRGRGRRGIGGGGGGGTDVAGLELGGVIAVLLRGGNGGEVAVYANSGGSGSQRAADSMIGGHYTGGVLGGRKKRSKSSRVGGGGQGGGRKPPTKDRPFQCPTCLKCYPHSQGLYQHRFKVHGFRAKKRKKGAAVADAGLSSVKVDEA
jgi:hypothetical protein